VKQKLTIANLALFMCYLIAFALSIKCFREPDLWWQIRTGQWILENGSVPVTDPFSYTFFGKPWINIKWGFEVLAAIVSNMLGPESVYLIQALFSVLLIFFLMRLANIFYPGNPDARPSKWAVILSLLITLFGIEYRIIGRPEMISHLLTVVFISLLLQYSKTETRWIWLLLPLQILWANMHEAFGLGVVLIMLFVAGAWVEYLLTKEAALKRKAITLSIIAAFLPMVILINPRGYILLLQPLEIFGQVQENKFTTELVSFSSYEYWKKEAYLVLVLFVFTVSVAGYKIWNNSKGRKSFRVIFDTIPAGYIITIFALAYLATTAYRNIVFLLLVIFPVLVYVLDIISQKLALHFRKIEIILLIIAIVFYGLVVTDKYYKLTNSRDHFGLQVLSSNNPVGAAEYIKQNHIKGRCFSDYLVSSYLLWSLQPDFKTFIDLRDLDVFPSSFFQEFTEAMVMPEGFAKTDSVYKFNYVVLLNRPDFISAHNILRESGRYKEVFADRVSSVYLHGNGAGKDIFVSTPSLLPGAIAGIINCILNPLYKPLIEAADEQDFFAAVHYLEAGENELALSRAKKAASYNTAEGMEVLGRTYLNMANNTDTDSIRDIYTGYAYNNYLASNNIAQNVGANNGIGSILFRQNNIIGATEHFEKALDLEPDNINTLMNVAECYKARVNEEGGIEKVIGIYKHIDRINPDNPNILLQLGAAYTRNGDCNQAREILLKVNGFQGFSPEQQKVVTDGLRQCAN
jgi:hypothetical protein